VAGTEDEDENEAPPMNQQLLLNIYEKIEALVSRLPGPLQSAVLNELRPIKQIFIAQRPARIALLGQASANASALLSALLGSELKLIDSNQSSGWVSYEQKGKGGFRVLDARQLTQSSRSWADLTNVLSEEAPTSVCSWSMETLRGILPRTMNRPSGYWILFASVTIARSP